MTPRIAGMIVVGVDHVTRFVKFPSLIAVLMFAVGSTASGPPPAVRANATTGWVQTVAMSGSQVAYSTGAGLPYGPGDKLHLWDVRTGKSRLISAHNPDPVYEVAISGTRVSWVARGETAPDPTAELNESLFAASLRKPSRPQLLGTAYRTESEPVVGVPRDCTGNWIGGLVGSANLLAVNRWQTARVGEVTHAELDLVTSTGLRQEISGAGSIVAQSTNGGRIAVLRSTDAWPGAGDLCGATTSPTVGLYTTTGKLLREFTVAGVREVALSGADLVVLTKASRLAVYDWRSGRRLNNWRVPHVSWVHLEDVYRQIAVYSAYSQGRNLHLLQLATGKDVLLTKGSGLGPYYTRGDDAQLEAPGLVYAVDKPGTTERGKLVFVPMRRVLAAVAKGHVR